MAPKTLCPIKDIKGWHHYNKCPYTKKIFSNRQLDNALTSAMKDRFFSILQKNIGQEGHLTKEKMKATLGEFSKDAKLSSEKFYVLCKELLPGEKQRYSMAGKNGTESPGGTASSGASNSSSLKSGNNYLSRYQIQPENDGKSASGAFRRGADGKMGFVSNGEIERPGISTVYGKIKNRGLRSGADEGKKTNFFSSIRSVMKKS